ncbi:glycosyltransferase [Calothrix rhizosoleniae]|uniref:glycosyltransferase n=1 Tax=Calothrix rhizosoleniae TaxID=888997 RepID=UPI000B4A37E3|nr:glycosyltransferase [Calothrix rhizosoleniae]
MRIGYLTGEYPRVTDTFIQREVMTMREMGADVHTFSIRRTGDKHMVGEEQKRERDRTFYILPTNPIHLLLTHLRLLVTSPRKYLKAIKLAWSTSQPGFKGGLYQLFYFLEAGILAQQIKARKITHLHNHIAEASGTVAMLAGTMGGFTYSFTLHGPYIFFKPYQWRLDEKIKRALFVSCISHFARSQGMIFATPEKWQRMHIVHCGIDPTLFKPFTHKGQGKRLLFVGRLAAAKGLPVLLESLVTLQKKYPDILLTVIGDGAERTQLQKQTIQLGLSRNVNYVGSKSQTEVREYLQETDIFVMSSFAEGVPVVLMEAMATGIPVVATQIAGISELVEHEVNGYLLPPGDSTSLTHSIEILLNNPETRVSFGTKARQKVKRDFNIRYEVSWLYQLMNSALQGRMEPIRPDSPSEQLVLNSNLVPLRKTNKSNDTNKATISQR